jgi:hypothetical protein
VQERALYRSGTFAAMPAWKSSYRVLFSNAASGARTATLQGWAVVDNTTAPDWKDVHLTLVSGAPQSFIQQISRPNTIVRPEIGMSGPARVPAMPVSELIPPGDQSSVPVSAGSFGGGMGLQISRSKPMAQPAPASVPPVTGGDYQQEAEASLGPETASVDLDDLFEYKLAKPIGIRSAESASVPIVQTGIDAERVSVWNEKTGAGRPITRALWIRNTSNLLLDQGSFTIVEDGIVGGQGQIVLLHPGERHLAPYTVDQALRIEHREAKDPTPILRQIEVANGTLVVRHRAFKEQDFAIQNTAASPRTVVLEVTPTLKDPKATTWERARYPCCGADVQALSLRGACRRECIRDVQDDRDAHRSAATFDCKDERPGA